MPTSVTPDRGFAGKATPILIHGTGFSVLAVQPSSGGAPVVNEAFQAWMGSVPLQEVRWVDEQTLSATVPAGLAPGPQPLRVEGPFGTSGELASAFTVEASALASLAVAVAAAPARVSEGQSITVTLTVTNTGSAEASNAVPGTLLVTGTGAAGAPTSPTPPSISALAPGASGTFVWTCPTTGAGTLAFAGSATATDVFSGTAVSGATDPAHPAEVTVERPAALTASLPGSGAAALGQEFAVAMTVVNTGGAAASDVVPAAPALTPPGLASLKAGTGPVPGSVSTLAAGASATFTWTFVAGTTPGIVRISAEAAGTDENSGAAVSSGTATSGDFTLGAAGIQAALSATPTTALAGQVVTLTLTATNPGLADLRNFSLGIPAWSSTDGASASPTGGPSPGPPAVLAAGQTLTFTWTFTPTLAANAPTGHLDFVVPVGGTDAFSGGPVTAQPTARVTVDSPTEVTATSLATTPGVLSTGQDFTATLTVARTGGGTASVTGVSLTGTTCTTPPVTPVNVVGATLSLTWSGCTAPPTPQTLNLAASATWVSPSEPLVPRITNSTSIDVLVRAPPALTVTFAAQPPSPVRIGQVIAFTAIVRNGAPAGGEAVTGVTVTPSVNSVSGKAAATCTAATPVSATIAAGSSGSFGFTCTPTKAGTLTFTATATGRAASSGAALSASATTSPATTVQR
jgi:hypothetical protein